MAAERRGLRCAIYTRKSSEEGLEQAFNSLDAQREACGAYIESQRHEGWRALGSRYDDGGYSGGNLERPALARLLADISSGKIDVVVVYKVDRLTRSLADFAKIVEIFDAQGVSFVSVTQQFNTTSSMGRLTLNVLLSFAQFEREVTGERIRDKIAASKKKGMWMGGYVPLGYDVIERKLVVNQSEATLIGWIYERYLALGCVRHLKAELDRKGIKSKVRHGRDGHPFGGSAFSSPRFVLSRQPRSDRAASALGPSPGPVSHQPCRAARRNSRRQSQPARWTLVRHAGQPHDPFARGKARQALPLLRLPGADPARRSTPATRRPDSGARTGTANL